MLLHEYVFSVSVFWLILSRKKNGTYLATGHRATYCSGSEISGMLTFIWNARKRSSQPVELFMQYVGLGITANSYLSYLLHYGLYEIRIILNFDRVMQENIYIFRDLSVKA